ncbi:class I SAM-dependent DNA methyltransferase [Streptomyces sp. NPDC102487]|uniref:class I SAM-dependent DNA methyltransferase n=1 Tax=Streptomyces sp. NPDC102487 TaxID=3366182 RepID=UPI003810C824
MTESTELRATRDSYDTVAASYAELIKLDLKGMPYDRAMLGEFMELVRDSGPVGDLGCGPGHVTAYLAASGVPAFGIDLSPGMVEIARKKNPELRFEVGSMAALELPDAGLGGVVSWYSIVHMALEQLPTVFAEFFRVLTPGGHLLLAFKAGDRKSPLNHAYGHDVSLTVYWQSPERVAELLEQAGFAVQARLIRAPGEMDKGPQAFVLARRPAAV